MYFSGCTLGAFQGFARAFSSLLYFSTFRLWVALAAVKPTSPLEYPGEVAQTRQLLLVPPGNFIERRPPPFHPGEIRGAATPRNQWWLGHPPSVEDRQLQRTPLPPHGLLPPGSHPAQALLAASSFAPGGHGGHPRACWSRPRPRRAASTRARRGPRAAWRGGRICWDLGAARRRSTSAASTAHEGGSEERVGETARVVPHELGDQRRGVPGAEEGVPVVVGLPREIPVAGEHQRAAWRHPRPAVTGRKKRRVALPGRRTQWYSTTKFVLFDS
jgi:hypothetical protein